jgi:hypothetical protein
MGNTFSIIQIILHAIHLMISNSCHRRRGRIDKITNQCDWYTLNAGIIIASDDSVSSISIRWGSDYEGYEKLHQTNRNR